jgi:hypothetical protein
MLIDSFVERRERQLAKQERVMEFLVQEVWTSFGILRTLLGLSAPATLKTLNALERIQLIRRHRVVELRMSLWGITPQGIVMTAYGDGCTKPWVTSQYFEPSKLKLLGIPHKLAIQEARLCAERARWGEWTPGFRLPHEFPVRPDARVLDPAGRKIAVEIERTVKTQKRYAAIFANYLQQIKAGEFDLVHYVCPDAELAPRLARLFGDIKAVPVWNERVPLQERHRARFQVFPLQTWPLSGGMDIFARKA